MSAKQEQITELRTKTKTLAVILIVKASDTLRRYAVAKINTGFDKLEDYLESNDLLE